MIKRLFFICLSIVCVLVHSTEKPIVLFVPSYNNIRFYEKNLASILAQDYTNYHVIYVDDCSTDGTGDAVAAYIAAHDCEDTITLIRNSTRRGAMYNHYTVAHALPDQVIMATLDGDDWLPDNNTQVLKRINAAYQNSNVWMTYGQFAEYPSGNKGFCKPLAEWPIKLHLYRDYPWVFSHMRTFYAGLFKQIPVGYFIRDNNFLQATCDLAMMFSLLELAGGRAYCINDIQYIYNTLNTQSDCHTRLFEQIHNDHWIRARKPLQPLTMHPGYELPHTEPMLFNWHISINSASASLASCTSAMEHGIASDQITLFYATHHNTDNYKMVGRMLETKTVGIESESNAKSIVHTYLDTLPEGSFILITTDTCKWHTTADWLTIMKTLTQTKALSYVATVSTTQLYDPTISPTDMIFTLLYEPFYVWKPAEVQGVCHHPYASPAYMISKTQLQHALNLINGNTLQELLENLAYLAPENQDDVMLCTAQHPCSPL